MLRFGFMFILGYLYGYLKKYASLQRQWREPLHFCDAYACVESRPAKSSTCSLKQLFTACKYLLKQNVLLGQRPKNKLIAVTENINCVFLWKHVAGRLLALLFTLPDWFYVYVWIFILFELLNLRCLCLCLGLVTCSVNVMIIFWLALNCCLNSQNLYERVTTISRIVVESESFVVSLNKFNLVGWCMMRRLPISTINLFQNFGASKTEHYFASQNRM